MSNIIKFGTPLKISNELEEMRQKFDAFGVAAIVFDKDKEDGKISVKYEGWHTYNQESLRYSEQLRILLLVLNAAIQDVEDQENNNLK